MDTEALLNISKNIVVSIAEDLSLNVKNFSLKDHYYDKSLPKEIKASADTYIEKKFIQELSSLDVSILTEESGLITTASNPDYLFILDPIDGTYNFVRGSGSSCISLALWRKSEPIFGIIYDLQTLKLTWGGKEMGSFCDDKKISVSKKTMPSKSLVSSGFPVRFTPNKDEVIEFYKILNQFAKVRMIGSAASSLNLVSQGLFDTYFEKNIMLWDVAAGLAIIEGSGGTFRIFEKNIQYSYDVLATNKFLINKINL